VPNRLTARRLLAIVDLAATAVFALEGALAGIIAQLDVFGVRGVGVVTATGGGIMRDALIGDTPPAAFRQQRYFATAITAAVLAILLQHVADAIPAWLLTGLDAAGLGLFAVAGAEKAMEFGLLPLMATLMGGLTAVGGGTLRDLLLGEVPAVLRVDVYAVAALAGAATLVVARDRARLWVAMSTGAGITFVLRVAAAAGDWNLPVPGR